MAHAEKCPVCNGTGKVDDKSCHGCYGLGWVTIYDGNTPTFIPMVPYQPVPYYPTNPWVNPWITWNGTQ